MTDIIIHIGLPKTATTTVQYEIFSAPENRHFYLGKFRDGSGLFRNTVADYLSGQISLEEARSRVAGEVSDDGPYLYSDEMLSVSSTLSWREKLEHMTRLLEGYTVSVVATLRRPSNHALSVFAELQPTGGWRDFSQFITSEQADWLDPSVLHDAIIASGLAPAEKTFYFDFDRMIAEDFASLKTAVPGLFIPEALAELNARKKIEGAIVSRPIGLYDLAYSTAKRLRILNITPPFLRRAVGNLMRRTGFSWRKTIAPPEDASIFATLDTKYDKAIDHLKAL